jgi:hypothetical protein
MPNTAKWIDEATRIATIRLIENTSLYWIANRRGKVHLMDGNPVCAQTGFCFVCA